MCEPIGEIAEVFEKLCAKYKAGVGFDEETANRIASEVDPRFVLKVVQIEKGQIGDEKCKSELLERARKLREEIKDKQYVGTYLFLPLSREEVVKSHREKGAISNFINHVLSSVGLCAGRGRCIGNFYGSDKGKRIYVMFAYCDEALYRQIVSHRREETCLFVKTAGSAKTGDGK
ncbi:hypothetical protein COT30_00695 [Candidatus Micrarchaeota archaeon CG08_land_8_20_14_0_20_49_17]|nr:MAG: hypothetical protein AUJ13_02390 [Candidatus Micrarchaeota archaeon CG1_02_49_24]PIU10160.1 MAG: hypothetical protein COT30_00695 [Candidatus Micrarchaeota archaeon CG08_land_8_20_14_0_20_49_17]PIU81578.1 MAG: hypothetical protein COS70_03330 [Candidatus Micrarchaeota archaeon CG06_land_8_20_14_3_00_50_6]HII54233.1 hypothetical protein [Candidatus Micrarchaeota archaeon]